MRTHVERRRHTAAGLAAFACITFMAFTMPLAARADTYYTVHVCDPSYANANNAMTPAQNDFNNIAVPQWCAGYPFFQSGRGLQAYSKAGSGYVGNGGTGGWTFNAPPGTSVNGLSYWGSFSCWDGWVSEWADNAGDNFGDCNTTNNNVNPVGAAGLTLANPTQLYVGITCTWSSCQPNDTHSIFGPAASMNLYEALFTVDDPFAQPQVQAGGNLWPAPTGWISGKVNPGSWSVDFSASDPSGVCDLRATFVNQPVGTFSDVNPDYTWPAPCAPGGGAGAIGSTTRSVSWAPDLAALPNGPNTLQIGASNSGGGWALPSETIMVDNNPPQVPTGLTIASGVGPLGWSATPTFAVSWDPLLNHAQPAAPITAALTSMCSVGGCTGGSQTSTVTSAAPQATSPGAYSFAVQAEDSAQNVSGAASIVLQFDPSPPGPPRLGPQRNPWLSASDLGVVETLASAPGLSGIAGYSVAVDSSASSNWAFANIRTGGSPNGQFPISNLPDGVHTLCAIAFSGAGVASPQTCTNISVDTQAPTVTVTSSDPSSATQWVAHSVNYTLTAKDQPGLSGVASISYQIDGGVIHTLGPTSSGPIVAVVSGSGRHKLAVWATDHAGNATLPSATATALIDTTGATGQFEPPDPASPTTVTVDVSDPYSGVAGGTIQLQERGAWTDLPTTLDTRSGTLTTTIPDTSLADGSYPARAVVTDGAGQQTTITDNTAGKPAAIGIPIRIPVELNIASALIGHGKCHLPAGGTRAASVARTRRPQGRARRRAGSATRSRAGCRAAHVPGRSGVIKLAYGQTVTLHGLLQGADGGGPVPNTAVSIKAQADARGEPSAELGSVQTDSSGRFSYTIPPGPSEILTLSYPGAAGVLPASVQVRTRVKAGLQLSIAPLKVLDGGTITLRGTLPGGFLPAAGEQVDLLVKYFGRWQTFRTLAVHHARFSTTFAFDHTRGACIYPFRAATAADSAYPFASVKTAPIDVFVLPSVRTPTRSARPC